jgi:hypothetical protein
VHVPIDTLDVNRVGLESVEITPGTPMTTIKIVGALREDDNRAFLAELERVRADETGLAAEDLAELELHAADNVRAAWAELVARAAEWAGLRLAKRIAPHRIAAGK